MLHGDLHLKNVFVRSNRVTLIDLDSRRRLARQQLIWQSSRGDQRNRSVARQPRPRGLRLREAITLGSDAHLYTAAALLSERVVRAITRMRMPVLRQLAQMVDEVRTLARAAGRV